MSLPGLNERERRVLEAVIQTYVETAQPAGSRSLAHKFGLDVSPATIRNTMSDLEEKGYLFHPHASAGRVPTDVAYRVYVDSLIPMRPLDALERQRLTAQIVTGGSAVEAILASRRPESRRHHAGARHRPRPAPRQRHPRESRADPTFFRAAARRADAIRAARFARFSSMFAARSPMRRSLRSLAC